MVSELRVWLQRNRVRSNPCESYSRLLIRQLQCQTMLEASVVVL